MARSNEHSPASTQPLPIVLRLKENTTQQQSRGSEKHVKVAALFAYLMIGTAIIGPAYIFSFPYHVTGVYRAALNNENINGFNLGFSLAIAMAHQWLPLRSRTHFHTPHLETPLLVTHPVELTFQPVCPYLNQASFVCLVI